MQEKRKYERLPIKLKLEVSNLFKQDGIKIDSIDTEIEVFDISKAGIGFMSESQLPVNYYFNATLEFENTEEIILSVVKILYVTPIGESGFRYGCEFVGLPSMYHHIFDEYAKTI
ncbi:MAG: PilZ domain-containing protein [Lachnospiraceae bacterium]|nr:PilZ domain-containing protein [Lachnospiraceae bacterium]